MRRKFFGVAAPRACFATIAALLLFGFWGCSAPEPTFELLVRHRWFAKADREVMPFVCPEAQQVPLEAGDPLEAATRFVRRGGQMGIWGTDKIDPYSATPESIAEPLESARKAITSMSETFNPAIATASDHQRECYGAFALNCDKLIRGRDVISRIDTAALRRARDDYFKHRAALEKAFAKEGAPLAPMKTCEG